MIELERKSIISGKVSKRVLPITSDEWAQGWERRAKGHLIQDCFPQLSPEDREFVKTGITPEEWDAYFKDDEG